MRHYKIGDLLAYDFVHSKSGNTETVLFKISWSEDSSRVTVFPSIYPVQTGKRPHFRNLAEGMISESDAIACVEKHVLKLERADELYFSSL